MSHKYVRSAAGFALALLLALTAVVPVLAAAPANDNFGSPTAIGALPFSDAVDITEATTEPGEPQFCGSSPQTVWYSFTPAADATVQVNMQGSNFGDTVFSVYEAVGSGFGGLNVLNCANFGGSITFSAQSGTQYYIQAGKFFGGSGTLTLNLLEIPAPPNDDFSNAITITSLPFSDSGNTLGATMEANEPIPSCGQSNTGKTAWYAFTPSTSGSFLANMSFNFSPVVAVYTGNSLDSLTEVACRNFSSTLAFQASAGTIYYVQIGGYFGDGGPYQFNLDVTPPPTAGICSGPSDPSVFDTMQFNDCSFDPAGQSLQSFTWNFGDGTPTLTTNNCCVNHRYAADGDYTVQHGVTTADGRSGSVSQVVHVKTHDVAIMKFTVPQTARGNTTKTITVDVSNKRYSENVQVTLIMGLPGGGEQVIGTLTLFVPARAKQPTTFKFSYTFTSSDAAIGKVTFKAVANVINSRDAFPSDNTAIATTLVSR